MQWLITAAPQRSSLGFRVNNPSALQSWEQLCNGEVMGGEQSGSRQQRAVLSVSGSSRVQPGVHSTALPHAGSAPLPSALLDGVYTLQCRITQFDMDLAWGRGKKKKKEERKRKQSPNSAAGKILRAPAMAKINSKDGLLLSKGIQKGSANPILTGVLLGVLLPSPTNPAVCWGLSWGFLGAVVFEIAPGCHFASSPKGVVGLR